MSYNKKKVVPKKGNASPRIVVRLREDPELIDKIVALYLVNRRSGRTDMRARSRAICDVVGCADNTVRDYHQRARLGEEPYKDLFDRIRDTEQTEMVTDWDKLTPTMEEQPFRHLEKKYTFFREDGLNKEAVEQLAGRIAGERLVLVARKVKELEVANPKMSAADLLATAVEHMAEGLEE